MNLEEYLLERDVYTAFIRNKEEADKRKKLAIDLAKKQKEENINALKFVRIDSADKNNMRRIVFKDKSGKEFYPALLNTSLPLDVFKEVIKMLKNELE